MESYLATLRVRQIGHSTVGLFLSSTAGHPRPGDMICIKIARVDDPRSAFLCTKTVRKKGSSSCISLDKSWGFMPGELVVINYHFASRAPVQKEDQSEEDET